MYPLLLLTWAVEPGYADPAEADSADFETGLGNENVSMKFMGAGAHYWP